MKFAKILAAAAVALGFAASANASTVTLLSLINPAGGSSESYSLTFTATSTESTLSDGGYQLPGFTHFIDNSVVLDGTSTNLLGQTWVFTPAASGSDTSQFNDGTAVNALNFGGVTLGSYDVYSQTFATTPGDSYTYTFDVPSYAGNPDGYYVTVSNASLSSVPEPANVALLLAGVAMVGGLTRKSRRGDRQ